MSNKLRIAFAILIIAVISLASCKKPEVRVEGAKNKPATLVASVPSNEAKTEKRATDTPSKPPSANESDAAPSWSFADSSSLDALESYRSKTITTVTEDGAKTGVVEVLLEIDRKNSAEHMAINTTDPELSQGATESGSFEMIRIGQDSYAKIAEDQWLAMQIPDDELIPPAGLIYRPESLLQSAEGKYMGEQTVNGLECKYYEYDRNALAQSTLFESVTEASGKVWVSTLYNVATRSIVHMEGKDLKTGKLVTVDVTSEITDINTDIEIVAPEGVEKAAAPDDIPIMADAKDVVSMMGMTRYETAASADKVVKFYNAEMIENGWKAAEVGMPGFISFTKDKRTARIAIQGQGGQTAVAIMLEEGN